ncbi:MAG: hypothetical protein V4616_01820 [Bacteroidota bacterium]
MNYLLDCLFASLIIVCLILLFRLIRSRLMYRHKSPFIHPIILPIEQDKNHPHNITVHYELPGDTHVEITLQDIHENTLETYIDKDQKMGSYYLKRTLPETYPQYFLVFTSEDCRILKRIIVKG